MSKPTAASIWKEYNRGKDYLEQFGFYETTQKCYNFYVGDQWNGLKTSGETMPMLNIIKPVIDYKVATVNSDGFSISYTSQDYGETKEQTAEAVKLLNEAASVLWENLKMDTVLWEQTRNACIYGNTYSYFFQGADDEIKARTLDNVSLLFADEQQRDIQRQKYILIVQRLLVSEVKEIAKQQGLSDEDIAKIKSDKNTDKIVGELAKVEIEQDDDGKVLCIKRLWKESGTVHICSSTETVIYQPDTEITGLTLYPIAQLTWTDGLNTIRGLGEVQYMIPNQIEINKSLARQAVMIKQYAFPHLVYDKSKLSKEAVKALGMVGSTIGVDANGVTSIGEVISYLNGPGIPSDSYNFATTLATQTRELAGAGEVATGSINPERASGAAILAVQEAAALPLSGQEANVKQYIEDVANIWLDLWKTYTPETGMTVYTTGKAENGEEYTEENRIPLDVLESLDVRVRIDVSPANPYSKYSREQTLGNLFQAGAITFEEYVKALDDDATAPKATLMKILSEREQQPSEAEAAAMEANSRLEQNEQMMLQQNDQMDQQNEKMQQLMQDNARLQEMIRKLTEGSNGNSAELSGQMAGVQEQGSGQTA